MPRYRVLIVDDQRDIRRVLAMGLATLEMKVEVVDVPSAEEAMLVATHGGFDLMVADVRLPGMSGLELARRVQKLHPDMKVMLMTGVTDPAIRQEVETAEVAAFFYKPIELDAFLNAVRQTLGALVHEPGAPLQSAAAKQEKTLALVNRLEDLRRRAVMGMAAVLNIHGEVLAQAGFLTALYQQAGLASDLAGMYAAMLKVSQVLQRPEPEISCYLAGHSFYFFIVSINKEHFLALTAEQPFQDQIEALRPGLVEAIRELDQMLAADVQDREPSEQDAMAMNALVGEAEKQFSDEQGALFRPLEEELAQVEVSDEDRAAVEALFSQDLQRVKKQDADKFWDSLTEESETLDKGEGTISYDEARHLGLAPE